MTKTAKLKQKPAETPELYSTIQAAEILGVDRLVFARKARLAGIRPHPSSTENCKLWELTDALQIAVTRTDSDKDEKDIEQKGIKNELLQMELDERKGLLVKTKDVTETVTAIFSAVHKRVVIHDLEAMVKKVRAAKDLPAAKEIAKQILNKPFMEVRENHKKFLLPISSPQMRGKNKQ